MDITINNTPDRRFDPAAHAEAEDEPSAFGRLLMGVATPDELRLLCLLGELADGLLDGRVACPNGRAMRAELRRMWLSTGLTKEKYYRAFGALASRRVRV